MIDNVTKKQIGGHIPNEGSCSEVMKTKIGNEFKGYGVYITLDKETTDNKPNNEEGEKEDGNKTAEQQGDELGQEI